MKLTYQPPARHKERDADDKAFEKGIIDLFNELSTWVKQGLNLKVASSSSQNLGRRSLDFNMGLGPVLRDIYFSPHNADLPQLPFIRPLYILNVKRNLHPSVIGWIISSLPRLEKLALELNAPPPKNKDLQKEYRLALAKALDSPSLRNLKSLYNSLEESIPLNHSYETQTEDPAYPDGDA